MMYRLGCLGIVVLLQGCGQPHLKHASLDQGKKAKPPVCLDANDSNDTYGTSFSQELEPELPSITKKVNDLEYYPQTLLPYFEGNYTNQETALEIQKHFEERYYSPWSYLAAPICVKEAQWPISAFRGGYGSNLKPVDTLWIDELVHQSNFDAFSTLNKPAITTKWMNMRVFPTYKPLYNNPARPGEGYPFDLLQNSSVAFNEPIFVSHYSKDGSWAYIFTNNASGWVESDGIAVLSPKQMREIQEKKKLFITQDRVPLYTEAHKFIAYSRIGMVLPLLKEMEDSFRAMYVNNTGISEEIIIPKEAAHIGYTLLNKDDLIKIGSYMLRNTYGWGGMFEERDCSSMIRDYLTPFGIWLPRNSASQAKKGEVISFSGLDNMQKLGLIQEKGVPFETILYKKGHVLLYIGMYEGNVMVMHNIWGIRTSSPDGKKGRVIVGKAAITTLKLGQEVENFDADNMLLNKLVSMNIFTHDPLPYAGIKVKKKRLSRL